jgi:hypothetical protein
MRYVLHNAASTIYMLFIFELVPTAVPTAAMALRLILGLIFR